MAIYTLAELLAKCTPENRHEEATVDTTQASPAVIDMFTALSRKIVSLEKKLGSVESQLRDVQNNLEKQAIELENARHRIAKHADRFAAVEDKVEMLIDDIYELDERSQVLNAINKYYERSKR
jgi:predicted  nucleic acid-binding Zn-ribbon protein